MQYSAFHGDDANSAPFLWTHSRDLAHGARPFVKIASIFHALFVIIALMTQRILLRLAPAHLKCTHASEKHESAKDAEP
jgi:hypothetical protein